MRILILHSGNHHSFLNNLFNVCNVCQYCTTCRPISLNFSSHLYGIVEIQGNLPPFIEDPQVYVPSLPECDLVIAFDIHPDILLALPKLLESKTQALIVPADAPHWLQPGLRRQLAEDLRNREIEFAFPKPYCSLDIHETHFVINQFITQARIGRPFVDIELNGDTISRATCLRSAPCGSTYYICKRLKNVHIDHVIETVSESHHSFPCNASMARDSEVKDTILHEAGFIAREAVCTALERAG